MSFEDAFKEVIGFEGGYVNDPLDPGGETKWGISKRAYPQLDIKNLTAEDAKQIYWRDYWNKLLLAQVIDEDMAQEIFEQAINLGRERAVGHAQRALSMLGVAVEVDGLIGPQTVNALNSLRRDYRPVFLKVMNGLQFMVYLKLAEFTDQKRFFVGWLKRVNLEG